jgi:hypothetical protein
MDIVYSFARRARHTVAVFGSLLALVVATLVPGLASAAQLTERSIGLSSSSKAATNVSYEVKFTPVAGAGAFLVDFCTNSSLVDDTCTAPTGFAVSGAASADATAVAANTAADPNVVVVTKTLTGATPVDVNLTGVTNPSGNGVVYARIITFDTAANAKAYTAGSAIDGASPATGATGDAGSAAFEILDSFGVSASVTESMSFCVGKTIISANCDLTGNAAPTLKLGKTIGSTIALDSSEVSSDTMFTQLNTNALHGAVISLKSSATNCGGLELAGDTTTTDCFIAPAGLTGGISPGDAKFGVKTATATGGSDSLVPSGSYNSSTYVLHAATDNSVGVTSTYGDPFLNTAGAKANNMNMQLTFGASTNASVPAGNYSADLSLIATGTF